MPLCHPKSERFEVKDLLRASRMRQLPIGNTEQSMAARLRETAVINFGFGSLGIEQTIFRQSFQARFSGQTSPPVHERSYGHVKRLRGGGGHRGPFRSDRRSRSDGRMRKGQNGIKIGLGSGRVHCVRPYQPL